MVSELRARDVEAPLGVQSLGADPVLGELADDEQLPLERRGDHAAAGDVDLPQHRHGAAGEPAEARCVHRDVAPAEDALALGLGDLGEDRLAGGARGRIGAAGRPGPPRSSAARGSRSRAGCPPCGRTDPATGGGCPRRRRSADLRRWPRDVTAVPGCRVPARRWPVTSRRAGARRSPARRRRAPAWARTVHASRAGAFVTSRPTGLPQSGKLTAYEKWPTWLKCGRTREPAGSASPGLTPSRRQCSRHLGGRCGLVALEAKAQAPVGVAR